MTTGGLTQGAHSLRGGVSLAVAEQTAFWLVIGLMLALGVIMMVIAAWVYRSNDPEPEVLAPLEVMGKKNFREGDPETQQRQLDEARPVGATTLRSAVSVPRRGRRPVSAARPASQSPAVDEKPPVDLEGDEQPPATDDAESPPKKRRTPRRYLAGDKPARLRSGEERFKPADDDADRDDRDRGGDRDDRLFEVDDLEDDYRGDDAYGDDEYRPDPDRDEYGDDYRDDAGVDDAGVDDLDERGAFVDVDLLEAAELDDSDVDDDIDDVETDEERVHRRSRLPFRASTGGPGSVVELTDDGDDDLSGAVMSDDDLDDGPDGGDRTVSGRAPVLKAERGGPADDGFIELDELDDDDDLEAGEGDTWLDRAEREEPNRRFRRDRTAADGGGRWRRNPFAAAEDDLGATDDIDDDIDEFADDAYDDSYADPALAADAELYSDPTNDQFDQNDQNDYEEEAPDMDFEHDDFDAYGDPAQRPNVPGDPFFEDDFDGEWNESTSPGRPRRRARRAAEAGTPTETPAPRRVPSAGMSTFDPDAMIDRFRERAAAVRRRPLPPVAGEERQEFIQQAKIDYQDFAMIGDAEVTIEDGVLVLRVDLRG